MTQQNIAHLNRHNSSDVMLLAIVQYTLHTRNFVKCKIVVQISEQQGANGWSTCYEALIS
jgi:hypothetical protein